MSQVNITEAARLTGISRSYFYRKYIKECLISVTSDNDGNKQIDTAELLRVFGTLEGSRVHCEQVASGTQEVTPPVHPIGNSVYNALTEIEQLKRQLSTPVKVFRNHLSLFIKKLGGFKAEKLSHVYLQQQKENEQRLRDEFFDREQWYMKQIEYHQDKIKLLTDQFQISHKKIGGSGGDRAWKKNQ